ncbi:MAG: polysaccharide deacetylase family protein [Lachnospiraceae bacterium]|nr:polysaccharide deacetylase family protein [Lachnospiraceae bacterium]
MENWNLRRRAAVLLGILLLDAAMFGTAMGVMRAETSSEEVRAAGVQEMVPETADAPSFVALTFDDGPDPVCTPKLLDGLKERGVHATFFLMGQSIPGNEALVLRMKEEGHLIGNHSYRHIQLTKAREDSVCEAVEQTEELIASITGERPQYLRPPYGDWNENLECRMNLTTVFWSVDSLDWKLQHTSRIVRRLEQSVGPGDIILMHDIFPTSVEAALQIVDSLQAKGYRFVTVDELLVD